MRASDSAGGVYGVTLRSEWCGGKQAKHRCAGRMVGGGKTKRQWKPNHARLRPEEHKAKTSIDNIVSRSRGRAGRVAGDGSDRRIDCAGWPWEGELQDAQRLSRARLRSV